MFKGMEEYPHREKEFIIDRNESHTPSQKEPPFASTTIGEDTLEDVPNIFSYTTSPPRSRLTSVQPSTQIRSQSVPPGTRGTDSSGPGIWTPGHAEEFVQNPVNLQTRVLNQSTPLGSKNVRQGQRYEEFSGPGEAGVNLGGKRSRRKRPLKKSKKIKLRQ